MKMRYIPYVLLLILSINYKYSHAQDPNFHIYLCFGQSNMAGAGDIEQQDLTVNNRFQFMKPQDCPAENEYKGNWYNAIPPLWGCSGGIGPSDYFGRTMVENMPTNITIGVVVVGVPGCKIELFGKTGYEGFDEYNYVPSQYNGSAYAWLLDLARQAQNDGVIKGFLLHQGESNTGDQQWPTKVKDVYDNLITDLGLNPTETPLLSGEMLYQDQGGVCWGHNAIIANLPGTLPNSYVISAQALPGKDQYHFNSEGNRTFGVRYAQQMLALIPNGPSVVLTNPEQNAGFVEGSDIEISADASDSEGNITRVEFYNGTTPLGEDASSPFTFLWKNVQAGSYELTAKAYNNSGNDATSQLVNIKVHVAQAPLQGTPHPIPGIVEFENFDVGGNGFAYYDADAGTNVDPAPNFRTNEDVDIENCADVDGGYNIGWTTAGEWMEYTVNVAETGAYDLVIRAACNGDGRTVSLTYENGTPISDNIAIPNTAAWQAWTDVVVNDVQLLAGEQVLRLTIGETDYVNLNYMSFQKKTVTKKFSLKAGWNIIAYPFKEDILVEDALQTIWGNIEMVKNFDGFYDKSLSPALNSLTHFTYGKAYFVYADAPCELQLNH